MSKKYLAQIKSTPAYLGKLYCLDCNIKLYVENNTLYADFSESAQHEYIAPFNNGDDIYELFFNEFVYPVSIEYKDYCDSWIFSEVE